MSLSAPAVQTGGQVHPAHIDRYECHCTVGCDSKNTLLPSVHQSISSLLWRAPAALKLRALPSRRRRRRAIPTDLTHNASIPQRYRQHPHHPAASGPQQQHTQHPLQPNRSHLRPYPRSAASPEHLPSAHSQETLPLTTPMYVGRVLPFFRKPAQRQPARPGAAHGRAAVQVSRVRCSGS